MQRLALLLILFVMIILPALAQEDADAPVDETEQADTEATATVEEDEAAEAVVDDEYYQDVDDEDFRPSEDIPADQSIPFPTDI